MQCEKCQSPKTKVEKIKFLADWFVNRRKRKCLNCGHKFKTVEAIEDDENKTSPKA